MWVATILFISFLQNCLKMKKKEKKRFFFGCVGDVETFQCDVSYCTQKGDLKQHMSRNVFILTMKLSNI